MLSWSGRRARALCGGMALAAVMRLALLIASAGRLARSVEIATPVTSLVRLSEGFWLKNLGLSPYSGSVYHGSPLLLELIGPLGTISPILFLASDFGTAILISLIGKRLSATRDHYSDKLELSTNANKDEGLTTGEMAALLYLLNPFTVFVCVGGSTSSFENFVICLALYASLEGNVALAAFGWVMASHFSMYPIILLIPVAMALICGPDKPHSKILRLKGPEALSLCDVQWTKLWSFILWSAVWLSCVLGLCNRILRHAGGLREMLKETYAFILTVKDLTPNIGIYWYFFTEVFDFYRSFFLMVFHGNILCMVTPLSICFHHRPMFLSFLLLAVVSALKSYPSVGDTALYLGLMGLFTHELSDFKYAFLLFNGYICVAALGPVMFNLWIWRGTGNANFYFATALAYFFVQSILIVESVSSMLRFERNLKLSIKKEK